MAEIKVVWIVIKWVYDDKPLPSGWHEPLYHWVDKVFSNRQDAEAYANARRPRKYPEGQPKNTYQVHRHRIEVRGA